MKALVEYRVFGDKRTGTFILWSQKDESYPLSIVWGASKSFSAFLIFHNTVPLPRFYTLQISITPKQAFR